MNTSLQDLKEIAIRAHNGTSFSPEKRGESLIKEFEAELNSDLEEIKDATESQKTAYISKFRSLLSAWLHSKSRCISSMIAGPSNFPSRRAMKFNDWESNKYNAFSYWRTKAKKAIIKSNLPERNPLEEARKNLSERVLLQDYYKKINVAYRSFKKNPATLEKSDLPEKFKHLIRTWTPDYSFEKAPIQPYMMTNNLANIKRLEQRVKELEQKEVNASKENKEFEFETGKVIINYQIDRLQIQHNSKPERSVIDSLKHSGFHWSPSNMVWQRQLTREAIYSAEKVTGIEIIKRAIKEEPVKPTHEPAETGFPNHEVCESSGYEQLLVKTKYGYKL